MKIIISPAKKMLDEYDAFSFLTLPIYLDQTQILLNWLKGKNEQELKKVWNCNDKIVQQNILRLNTIDLNAFLSPALFCYIGLAYQHINADIMSQDELDYLQDHLRILSGFYGILKPFDGIRSYRLEMGCKSDINLYDYWNDLIYKELKDDLIINLASKEYSDCVEKYCNPGQFITVDFFEKGNNKLITKGTYAKMARGEMVRYAAVNQIESIEQLFSFNELGFQYSKEESNSTHIVFIRNIK